MEIKINGKKENIEANLTLADLLRNKAIKLEAVVIEYNGNICQRKDYETVILQADDCLEVVILVGGG